MASRGHQLYRAKLAVGWVAAGYLSGLLYAAAHGRLGDDPDATLITLIALIVLVVAGLVVLMVRHHRDARRRDR